MQFGSDDKLKEEAASTVLVQSRILEKRDFLKRVLADMSRYYNLDYSRVGKILDELGGINRLRRTVVHGWIRWSAADGQPILVDSHGNSAPAWPLDVANLNLKVLDWFQKYSSEQIALLRAVLGAYDALADRCLGHKLSAENEALLRNMKAKIAEMIYEPGHESGSL